MFTAATATTIHNIIHEEIQAILGIDKSKVLQEVNRRLIVHPEGLKTSDEVLQSGLAQEVNMLLEVRKGIENLNMNKLYHISRNIDSYKNNSKNNSRIVGEIIPKMVEGFLSSVPYLEQLIAVSDSLYKMIKPHSDDYPHLVKGLYFLQKLRYDLQNKHYIPRVTVDDYIYPAIIATDDPKKTKEQWLMIIDNMLIDLNGEE